MEQIGYMDGSRHLDAVFAALADPTRRAILTRLAAGEASVKELAAPFEMGQPAISKHLRTHEQSYNAGNEKAPAGASALSGAYLSLLTAGLRFLNRASLAPLA